MPRAHPPEFRRRAVELARTREKPVSEIAADLGQGNADDRRVHDHHELRGRDEPQRQRRRPILSAAGAVKDMVPLFQC